MQFTKLIESTSPPASSSKEVVLSVETNSSTTVIGSDFLEPTQDSVSDAESCSGLAKIHVSAIDLFSVH